MAKKKTTDYYDLHWENYSDFTYPKVKLEKVREFFHPIIGSINDKYKILDIGCGDGVHWNYLRRIEKLSINYSGVDVSGHVIKFLQQKADKNKETFYVMDACSLDFPDDYFDVVFAYGVIGYTEDPKAALREMYRVCKPGGWVGVFSPDINGISKVILSSVRSFAQLLGERGKRILADLMVPFFGLAPSETQISLKNASWRQVREVILTDIAPPKLEIIGHQKMISWFDQLRIDIKFDNKKVRTILWGLKSE